MRIKAFKRRMKNTAKRGIYERYIKRILDVAFSCILLFVLSPVFLITAISVRLSIGMPVIFKQKRGGLGGKVFNIYKFRSMTDKRDGKGELLPNAERLTRFGSFLRRTSIDELPQLVNVLRGEMSLVGPRPHIAEFLPHYTDEENVRHSVRPGLTGLAQVSGRNAISWNERFALDCKYAENVSFLGDLKIVLLTLGVLFEFASDGNTESFYDRN